MEKKSAESQLSVGHSRECLMTDGRSKSTGHARMVRATPTLYSMGPLAAQLGRWATNDSSRTHSQRKTGRALELLGLEILAKLAEADGVEKTARGSTRILCKRNSSGRRLHEAVAGMESTPLLFQGKVEDKK